jgi:hypothetical protein
MPTLPTVVIRYAPHSGELDVTATRAQLRLVAGLLDAAVGRISCDDSLDASPFETCLVALSVRQRPTGGVAFHVVAGTREVIIEGARDPLGAPADNLRDLALHGQGWDHHHVEFFTDHYYLEESSLSVVVRLAPGS